MSTRRSWKNKRTPWLAGCLRRSCASVAPSDAIALSASGSAAGTRLTGAATDVAAVVGAAAAGDAVVTGVARPSDANLAAPVATSASNAAADADRAAGSDRAPKRMTAAAAHAAGADSIRIRTPLPDRPSVPRGPRPSATHLGIVFRDALPTTVCYGAAHEKDGANAETIRHGPWVEQRAKGMPRPS